MQESDEHLAPPPLYSFKCTCKMQGFVGTEFYYFFSS